MKLDARAFALASAVIAAALFAICALVVAVAPAWTASMVAYMSHANLSALSWSLTWANFFAGLICWTVGTYIVAWALAVLYNRRARVQAS